MLTGDAYVVSGWSRVTTMFWVVTCVDVHVMGVVTGKAYVIGVVGDGRHGCYTFV